MTIQVVQSVPVDGSVVAIGAPYNDGNGDDGGHVRIYQNKNNTWTEIAQDIDGEAIDDNSGSSVSLLLMVLLLLLVLHTTMAMEMMVGMFESLRLKVKILFWMNLHPRSLPPGSESSIIESATLNENNVTTYNFYANESVTWSIVGGSDL